MIETVIGLLGGAAAAGVIYFAKKVGATIFVNKFGSIISKVYDVIDPVAGQLMAGYNGSEIQAAVKLTVARVADSNLDEADIVEITNFVISRFNPQLAASKVLDTESEEGKAALALLDEVKRLHDGVSFDELLAIAKAAKALI